MIFKGEIEGSPAKFCGLQSAINEGLDDQGQRSCEWKTVWISTYLSLAIIAFVCDKVLEELAHVEMLTKREMRGRHDERRWFLEDAARELVSLARCGLLGCAWRTHVILPLLFCFGFTT
jgi:hypothetical protein